VVLALFGKYKYVNSSLSFLNGHFPVGSGLADTGTSPFWILLELRVMDVLVTTGAIKHAKLHSE